MISGGVGGTMGGTTGGATGGAGEQKGDLEAAGGADWSCCSLASACAVKK